MTVNQQHSDDSRILTWKAHEPLSAILDRLDDYQTPTAHRSEGDPRAQRDGDASGPRRQVVGWSLVIAGAADLGVLVLIAVGGISIVALFTAVMVGLLGWLLVVTEIMSIRSRGRIGPEEHPAVQMPPPSGPSTPADLPIRPAEPPTGR